MCSWIYFLVGYHNAVWTILSPSSGNLSEKRNKIYQNLIFKNFLGRKKYALVYCISSVTFRHCHIRKILQILNLKRTITNRNKKKQKVHLVNNPNKEQHKTYIISIVNSCRNCRPHFKRKNVTRVKHWKTRS